MFPKTPRHIITKVVIYLPLMNLQIDDIYPLINLFNPVSLYYFMLYE